MFILIIKIKNRIWIIEKNKKNKVSTPPIIVNIPNILGCILPGISFQFSRIKLLY